MNLELLEPLQSNNYYKVYGLILQSNIVIKELLKYNLKENEEPDIIVKVEEMPEDIHKLLESGKHSNISEKDFWFNVEGVGIYRIVKGKNIYIEPTGGNLEDIKCFLLGTAMGVALIQKKIVAIHGGCIKIGDKSIIITGESGAGKSTLVSSFRMKGYKFLSDDVCAIKLNNKLEPMAMPAYPQQKLCKDAMDKFNLNKCEYKFIDEEREKYAIPALDEFSINEVPFKYLFIISVSNDIKEVKTEEIKGVAKLDYVINNIYRIQLANAIGFNREYFNNIVNISKNLYVYKIIRPNNKFTVNEQMKKILDIVNK